MKHQSLPQNRGRPYQGKQSLLDKRQDVVGSDRSGDATSARMDGSHLTQAARGRKAARTGKTIHELNLVSLGEQGNVQIADDLVTNTTAAGARSSARAACYDLFPELGGETGSTRPFRRPK